MQRVTVLFPSLLELVAFTTTSGVTNFEMNKAECWLECQLTAEHLSLATHQFRARVLPQEQAAGLLC